MASMSAVITTILNYFAYWCQDWSWKLPKRLLRTAAELLRITAHRRTPRLPPIAMVAPFVSFTVAYSWSCKRLLRPTRFPTLLFAIMHCCLFQLMRLLIFSSNSSTSCIRPQRLYKLALRPPLLDRDRALQTDNSITFALFSVPRFTSKP